MKNLILTRLMIVAFGLFGIMAFAQNISGKSVKVTVAGTSPLHDWTMTSSSANFSGTVNGNAINNVKFTMAAKNLKSTKGKMMDNKAYKALKADASPNITFTATSLSVGKSTLSGTATIAGVTKNISFPVTVVKNGASYNITGSESMKLSDFKMERPGFLGVTTGDAITVTVNIVAN